MRSGIESSQFLRVFSTYSYTQICHKVGPMAMNYSVATLMQEHSVRYLILFSMIIIYACSGFYGYRRILPMKFIKKS